MPPGTGDIVIEITALATDRASGGRGFSARFRLLYGFPGGGLMGGVFEVMEVTLFDPAGTQVASGEVQLTNPFRPRFPDDTHGIGYRTYGVFVLPYPNLVHTGFRLCIAWPPANGSGFHFGGAKDRPSWPWWRHPRKLRGPLCPRSTPWTSSPIPVPTWTGKWS